MADALKRNAAGNTKVIGSDNSGNEENYWKVSGNQDGHTVDRSSISARSDVIQINNVAKLVNTLGNGLQAENLSERKQVEIQPLDGTCFVGYSPTSQPHRIPRRQFYIAKIGDGVDLYIRKNGAASADVAVSELS